jgi:putative ABC transport system ATP-binding protein
VIATAATTQQTTSARIDPRVAVQGVEVSYSRDAMIKLPDLALQAQDELVLVGPSGSGKTTLLHVLAGLLKPTKGNVQIAGHDLTTMRESMLERFRAKTVGIVFQDFHLIDGYTALENVMVSLAAAGEPLGTARQKAKVLLAELGLEHRLYHRPKQLSTGERQRVAIARATATHPLLLLADEPTANLDRSKAETAIRLLREAAQRSKAILVVATHDPLVKDAFSKRIELA